MLHQKKKKSKVDEHWILLNPIVPMVQRGTTSEIISQLEKVVGCTKAAFIRMCDY